MAAYRRRVRSSEPNEGCFLVEWYQRGIAIDSVQQAGDQLCAAADLVRAGGLAVRFVLAVSVPADQTLFGVFTAESVEAITQTCRAAGCPADRITANAAAYVAPTP